MKQNYFKVTTTQWTVTNPTTYEHIRISIPHLVPSAVHAMISLDNEDADGAEYKISEIQLSLPTLKTLRDAIDQAIEQMEQLTESPT